MANQVEPSTAGGSLPQHALNEAHGGPAAHPSFHGRTVSWVAVGIIMAGFLTSGLGMIFGHHGPIWWLFWVGAALAAAGLLISFATNTFEDWY
jgi:hypothetical protein